MHIADTEEMYATAQKVVALTKVGVAVPARPRPPFVVPPLVATESDRQADAAYQAECLMWIKTVAKIYALHFSDDGMKRS